MNITALNGTVALVTGASSGIGDATLLDVDDRQTRPWRTSPRWLQIHPREKEATNVGYAQQTKPFVAQFGDVPMRDITVERAHR